MLPPAHSGGIGILLYTILYCRLAIICVLVTLAVAQVTISTNCPHVLMPQSLAPFSSRLGVWLCRISVKFHKPLKLIPIIPNIVDVRF